MKVRPSPSEAERARLRDYTLLWRLAFPHKSRESVRCYRKKNPQDHAAIYRKQKAANPLFNTEKRARTLDNRRNYERKYYARNATRISARDRARRSSDLNWRLTKVLRCLLNRAVNKDWKTGSAITLLGCSVASFKLYLESRFEPGMSWENYGRGVGKWNIDHIIPCALFDLTKARNQAACFHFSNQQPMWAIENAAKGARILC